MKNENVVSYISSVKQVHEEAIKVIAATSERHFDTWTQTLESLFIRFDSRQQGEAERWERCLAALQQRHDAYDDLREQRLQGVVTLVEARNAAHISELQAAIERAMAFREDVVELSRTLNRIAQGEGQLVDLQSTLSDNLRVLHETGQLDGAMHGLTAAIHLLTARSPQIGIHDRAA